MENKREVNKKKNNAQLHKFPQNRRKIVNNYDYTRRTLITLDNLMMTLNKIFTPIYDTRFVTEWTERIAKFALEKEKEEKKKNIIDKLLNSPDMIFHNKNISRDEAKKIGLNVRNLEDTGFEQDVLYINNLMHVLKINNDVSKVIGSSNELFFFHGQKLSNEDPLCKNTIERRQNKIMTSSGWPTATQSLFIVEEKLNHKGSYQLEEGSNNTLSFLQIDKMKELWDNKEDEYWEQF